MGVPAITDFTKEVVTMGIFMLIFIAYLIYVSYCKIVCLCFRGKQSNRFFATFLSTVFPIVGSMPAVIIASKYERRVGGVAPKMNDDVLRYAMVALQMLSLFLLFVPFFSSGSTGVNGINMILGLSINGDVFFSKALFLSYIAVLPVISAIVTSIFTDNNIRNIFAYITSLVSALTVFAIAIFADSDGELSVNIFLWIYCIVHVTVMLLSIFSMIKVRNKFLKDLELKEYAEEVRVHKAKAQKSETEPEPLAEGMYRCAKCGQPVKKGEICACRKENATTLNKLMVEQNRKETSDFCVYCRRPLEEGEKCSCVGEGFGITVKPEQFNGRKCQYCGQLLVGDSVCVCEKIMTKSVPASEEAKPEPHYYFEQNIDSTHVSDELAELEKKIESRFSEVKESIFKK